MKKNLPFIALYAFLLFGGLWHSLGVFTDLMRIMTTPVMAGTALLAAWSIREQLSVKTYRPYYLWAIFVIISTFILEGVGVTTGLIFGSYAYSEVLQPVIFGVPLVIGFAWLGSLCGAAGLIHRFFPTLLERSFVSALLIGLLMTLFDVALEPVAIHLNYWQWDGGIVPLQNYLAWFVAGSLLAWLGNRLSLLKNGGNWAMHSFLAQLLYFLFVIVFTR